MKEGLNTSGRETQWYLGGLVTQRNNLGCEVPVYSKRSSHVIFQYVVYQGESKGNTTCPVFLAYALFVYDGRGHTKWKAI